MTRGRVVLALLIAAALLLLAAGYLASQNFEVIDEGQILPYTRSEIEHVRFFGAVDVYIEDDVRPTADVFNTFVLLLASGMSLLAFLALRASGERRGKAPLFFAIAFAGTLWLAADELLSLHETIGHNLRFLLSVPWIERPDNAVTAVYAIPAAAVLFLFRDIILSSPRAVRLFLAGLGFFVLSVVLDFANVPGPEELMEVLGTLSIFAGFAILPAAYVGSAWRRRLAGPDEETSSPSLVAS